ncbi:hypothetical protein ACNJ7E_12530 [Rhodococcus sp. NM-2]|uniref:hypothetical protein n=1 Tax=Rhodococcus sp. NM-2 TaxID=3401174 RepID=UPI003AAFBFFE
MKHRAGAADPSDISAYVVAVAVALNKVEIALGNCSRTLRAVLADSGEFVDDDEQCGQADPAPSRDSASPPHPAVLPPPR